MREARPLVFGLRGRGARALSPRLMMQSCAAGSACIGKGRCDCAQHGYGRALFVDGSRYEGQWVAGAVSGRGSLVLGNGDAYEGEFLGGAQHGIGTLRLARGDTKLWVGCWHRGRRKGSAIVQLRGAPRLHPLA